MNQSSGVSWLYGTVLGRGVLKIIQTCKLDHLAVAFLRSPLSKCVIGPYIKRNEIPMEEYKSEPYRTFQEFFLREKQILEFDADPLHLISPCDGWLSAYLIEEDCSFFIKGSHYGLCDLLKDPGLSQHYDHGACLIFRLCASDYHHYCYIDDGTLEESHYLEGELHSVQPIACETYPVYTLNRRVWSLLHTDHFGPVIQTEVGALVVGGIVNHPVQGRFQRGGEKGHFDLSGSTIVMLFQKEKISLLPHIEECLRGGQEVRVTWGMQIGTRYAPPTMTP